MSLNKRSVYLATALAASLLASCASAPPKPVLTPEQAVAEQAAKRWEYMIAGNWADAYAMLTPGYREANTLEGYQANFLGTPVVWKSADVTGVECSVPESCVATVKVEFELRGGMPGIPQMETSQSVSESWLLLKGDWQHLPRR